MSSPADPTLSPSPASRSPLVSLLVGYFALTAVAYAFVPPGGASLALWSDIAHLPFPVFGLIVFAQTAAAARDAGVRRGWQQLTYGQLAGVIGDLTWLVADARHAEVPTAIYLAWTAGYAGFTVAGILRLMRATPTERQRTSDWVDAGILAAAGCVLAWYLVAQDTARMEQGDTGTLVMFFVTTSVNVGLLYHAGALWFRAPAAIPRRTALWFVAGFLTYVVADLLLERQSALKTSTGGAYLEVLYNLASLALVVGADAARRWSAAPAPAEAAPRRTDVVAVSATLIALVPLVLESRHFDLQHSALHGIALGLAALLLMVLWRQHLARAEIAALSDHRVGLEQQLWQAQKMDAIGRLAGGIAHDFNNILAAISSHAQLLRAADGPPSGREIEEIEYAAQRAAALTRRLLAFSRADVQTVAPVSVSAVVRSMEPILRRLLAAPVQFEVELADDDAWVALGDGQLEQVLLNLAVNGRDAMPDGGTLRITTRRERAGGGRASRDARGLPTGEWAVLDVCDTGHGMDDDVRARLFEPFFTTKPRGRGTGLGLVTVAGIADAANGRVLVETAPGRGTTMSLVLPLVAAPAPGVAERPEPPSRPPASGRTTILIVDDEVSVRRALAIYLSRHQFTVVEADHGRAALAALDERGWQVDLVLTDVEMPEMSGLELARAIRQRAGAPPVLFMSGYVDGRRGSGPDPEFAATEVLTKPFDLAYLLERVRGALSDAPPRDG